MKKKTGKMILLTGVLCIPGFAVCACGKTENTSDTQKPQVVQGEQIPEDDTGDGVSTSEQPADTEGTDIGNKPSAEWTDSTPDLEGNIKDLKDGQLTVIEAITEKADDGGDIIVVVGSGDDSEFNKVVVTYDQNTLFKIMTIYDGGARFEMSEATAADLASDQFIKVWGSSSDSGLKAAQICIVKVA